MWVAGGLGRFPLGRWMWVAGGLGRFPSGKVDVGRQGSLRRALRPPSPEKAEPLAPALFRKHLRVARRDFQWEGNICVVTKLCNMNLLQFIF
jgi:hypothetical protein